jgi:hypothetical protein
MNLINTKIFYSTSVPTQAGRICKPTRAFSVSRRSPTILRSGCGNFRTKRGDGQDLIASRQLRVLHEVDDFDIVPSR